MKLILFAPFLVFSSAALSAAEERIVPSTIDKVTVFLNRAQIFRSAEVHLPEGQTEIVLEDLSPYIDPNSIQVRGKGAYIILDVRHHVHYRQPLPAQEPTEVKALNRKIKWSEDSLRTLGYSIELIQARRQALQQEKQVLLTNPIMTNASGSDTMPVLREALIFLRAKLEDIHEHMVEAHAEEDAETLLYSQVQSRLQIWAQYKSTILYVPQQQPEPVQQVRVVLYSKVATAGTLEFNYTVGGASWSPGYDIRSSGPDKPVTLTYKANVRQSTGEDWKSVPLTLSTHDPSLGQSKPSLPIWYAQYYQQVQEISMSTMSGARAKNLSYDFAEMTPVMNDAKIAADYASVVQTFANVEFAIDLGYHIPSDGVDHLLLIQEKTLPATYRHYIVPKMDRESFIQAQITGWEDLNLLPGLANLFYDGTFVGRAHIDPRVFGDTMDLPMGRDRLVYAERKRVNSEEKSKAFSSDRFRTEEWSLEIRNSHSKPIAVVVQDQVPVAADPTIKVTLKKGDPDRHSEGDGMLEWDVELAANARKVWAFAYEIQWDKNRQLMLQ